MKYLIAFILIFTVSLSSCKKNNDMPDSVSTNHVLKPIAEFRINNLIDNLYVIEGKNLNLDNLSKNGVSYLWDFGNGIQFETKAPGKVYYLPCGGTYTISLTAINSAGEKSVSTKKIEVLCSGRNSHNQYLGD